MEAIEIIGAIVGLSYLYYEYHASLWLWVFGVIMPLIYVYLYFSCGYYANMGLNVYYVAISACGFVKWRRKKLAEAQVISCASLPLMRRLGVAFLLMTFLFRMILGCLGESSMPWMDGCSTALSVLGMWMMARGYYQQWVCWMLSEPIMMILCIKGGMYATAGMYLIYLIVSILAYRNWKKKYEDGIVG